MKYTETFDHEPPAVELEWLPDATAWLRLRKDIREEVVLAPTTEAKDNKQWVATTASAKLGAERSTETVETVTANFDDWWTYAENWEEQPPMTDTQRIDAVETVLADIVELVIGGDTK